MNDAATPNSMRLKTIVLILAIFGGTIVVAYMTDRPPTPAHTQPSKPAVQRRAGLTESQKRLWVIKGKDGIRAKLRDPKAAQFKDCFFHRGPDGMPMACGWVNAKNAFGAYTGFQRWVAAGDVDGLAVLEEDVTDFHVLWQRFCVE